MARVVFTPMLLLAVLIQAAFGCFARHTHELAAPAGAKVVASAIHDHHHKHGHGHHHGGHSPPAAHIHFGGENDEEHQHDESSDDTYSYVASRSIAPPAIDVAWVGHTSLDAAVCVGVSVQPIGSRERGDAFGRADWPSGQRLSLLGAWLI